MKYTIKTELQMLSNGAATCFMSVFDVYDKLVGSVTEMSSVIPQSFYDFNVSGQDYCVYATHSIIFVKTLPKLEPIAALQMPKNTDDFSNIIRLLDISKICSGVVTLKSDTPKVTPVYDGKVYLSGTMPGLNSYLSYLDLTKIANVQ